MRHLANAFLAILLLCNLSFADTAPMQCQEIDGSPIGACTRLKFPNGNLSKSGSVFTWSNDSVFNTATVATEAYDATGWNGDLTVPTKDAVRDKIETLGGASAPFVDTTSIVEGSADATKEFRFEVDGFTTGTVRVATPPNEDFTMVGLATTQTLTNKTINLTNNTLTSTSSQLLTALSDETGTGAAVFGTNPSLTGPIVLSGVKKRVFISATAGTCTTTAGCTDAVKSETTTNKVNYYSASFAADADDFWNTTFTMPENWDASTITYAVEWTGTTEASATVVWGVQCLALTDDDALDTAFGSAITVSDDVTVTGDFQRTAESGAITCSNTPVAGDRLWIQVYRDPDNASDDATNAAKFLGVWLTFGIDALTTED